MAPFMTYNDMSQSQNIIAICPECNDKTIYEGHAKRPRITCSECHTRFYIPTPQTQNSQITQPNQKSPPLVEGLANPTTNFIDDPDELLMSVATRELNKPNPDPRWAGVLISVRKENIGVSKKEGNIRSKFKSMNIKDIAKILSEKQNDIPLKPDLKESS